MARPLKVAGGRYLLRPLNVVFGAPSHIAILRALFGAGRGLTGREVARAAGIAQRAAMDGLGRLEEARLVRRTPVGRAYLFELERDQRLMKQGILPLLEQEGEIRAETFSRLRRAFEGEVLAGCVFGSVARGEERPQSDLDVCLVVRHAREKEAVQARASKVFPGLRRDLGVLASFLVCTHAELVRGYREGSRFFQAVVGEGERFAGPQLKELVQIISDTLSPNPK
jgi:predicted nucleotidyltransferase